MCERCDEATAGSIDVDRDVNAGVLLVLVQNVVDLPDGLVVTGLGASEDDEDANGVLINVLLD